MTPSAQDSLRFIPFRKKDILEMCLQDGRLSDDQKSDFCRFATLLQSILHFEFHARLEALKDAYGPLNPDRDTRKLPGDEDKQETALLGQLLVSLLDDANYETFSDQALTAALAESSLFDLKLHIDLQAFEEIKIFTRGARTVTEQVSRFFGLRKRTVEFLNYDRVLIYTRYRDTSDSAELAQGTALLKLFQNVPKADIEMLFPNTRLGMRLSDKLMIVVPALVGAGLLLKTKAGATLISLVSNPGTWLGLGPKDIELDRTALLAALAAVGALGSFVWKQFTNFKHRKLRFMQTLSDNLYFKNLDNNAGVFHKLIDEAEEEECKEVLLAYYFLLVDETSQTPESLDRRIESWFVDHWQVEVNFEIDDALDKLRGLGLVASGETITALPLARALPRLDKLWDGFFDYR